MKHNLKYSTSMLYRRLFFYVKPYSLILLSGIFANILYTSVDAGFTYMMRLFLDKGFINVDLKFVRQIPLIILIGITIRGLFSSIGGYCMTWVARSVVKQLRQKVFAHIIKLPADYYDEATSGQLLSKILYDVEQVAQVSADALTDFVQNTCLVIGLLIVMMIINWFLSLVFLLVIPCIALIVNFTNKRVRRISRKIQESMQIITEIAGEVIEGYQVVRIFNAAAYSIKKFNKATEMSHNNDMKVAFSKALNVFAIQFLIAIGISLIIFIAIKLTALTHITAGSFLAIVAAMLQLIKPMKTLATLNANFQKGLAGADSIFTLLDKQTEPNTGKILTKKVKGIIEFEHVNFGYRNGTRVLHDINFIIEQGETVALVGHSGSGKTTITNLLTRFYETNDGNIKLDGEIINDIALSSLRSQIALVSQHVMLFNDSIANNIAYGCFNVSQEQIVRAAQFAFADEFICRLAQGYDSKIGENGVLLSGGQRQRLAIARAILKDAPILILDEATSALDSESEHYIQVALEKLIQNRTTIIIAHRLSTIQRANKILVLQQGKVVEQGSHKHLWSLDGYYVQLCRAQKLHNPHTSSSLLF